jgi:hypothetical protein
MAESIIQALVAEYVALEIEVSDAEGIHRRAEETLVGGARASRLHEAPEA